MSGPAEHERSRARPGEGTREPGGGGGGRRVELATLAEFAAGIAHEINNPLAIIIEAAGWVSDLLDDAPGPESLGEMRKALRQIVTQAGRCRDITHNLLSFANRVPGNVQDVRLDELIREVVASLEKRAATRKVTIVQHLDLGVPVQRLSPTEMQQVLVNLVNNAMDAMDPSRGGRIDIVLRGGKGEALLDVLDNGSGIPEPVLERIFDPFFTTKPVGKGTGLGLSICYGIVTNLGGSMTVESKVGRGTTFHVRIPHQSGGELERPAARVSLDEEDGIFGRAPQPPTVVLLADNEEGFAEMVGKRLARRNVIALTSSTGEETIAQVHANPGIDVVVLDVKMPDMTGVEVLAEVKRRAPLVEVILLSSHTTVESAIDGMRLGAFDYLVKPCDLGVLIAQIEKARTRKLHQEARIMEARLRDITMRRP